MAASLSETFRGSFVEVPPVATAQRTEEKVEAPADTFKQVTDVPSDSTITAVYTWLGAVILSFAALEAIRISTPLRDNTIALGVWATLFAAMMLVALIIFIVYPSGNAGGERSQKWLRFTFQSPSEGGSKGIMMGFMVLGITLGCTCLIIPAWKGSNGEFAAPDGYWSCRFFAIALIIAGVASVGTSSIRDYLTTPADYSRGMVEVNTNVGALLISAGILFLAGHTSLLDMLPMLAQPSNGTGMLQQLARYGFCATLFIAGLIWLIFGQRVSPAEVTELQNILADEDASSSWEPETFGSGILGATVFFVAAPLLMSLLQFFKR